MSRATLETVARCPVCGFSRRSPVGDIDYRRDQPYAGKKLEIDFLSTLYQCARCHSKFISPRLSRRISKRLYVASDAKRWVAASGNKEATDLLRFYAPAGFQETLEHVILVGGSRGRAALDIGCFQGRLLDLFKQYGFRTYGLDLNRAALKVAARHHTVVQGDVQAIKKFRVQFDVITAFDLIEHLYEIDKFWTATSAYLKRGGLLVLLTGNPDGVGARYFRNRWWYFQHPEHIVFPSLWYYRSLGRRYPLRLRSISNVYHRPSYVQPALYRVKMYALLVWSWLQTTLFRQPVEESIVETLSSPTLSPDHYLLIFEKR